MIRSMQTHNKNDIKHFNVFDTSSMIKASSFQLNYVKLYKRSIELICLKDNESSRKKRISTLDF